jgi:hypothetical protein
VAHRLPDADALYASAVAYIWKLAFNDGRVISDC